MGWRGRGLAGGGLRGRIHAACYQHTTSLSRLRLCRPPPAASSPPLLSLSLSLGPLTLSVPVVDALRPAAPLPAHSLLAASAPAGRAPEVEQLRQLVEAAQPNFCARLEALSEPATDALLARWLDARCGDLSAAAAGLAAHVDWREAFYGPGPAPAGISEAAIEQELGAEKVLLQGLDAGGRPVVVIRACRHDMTRRDLAQTKRLICYVLDNACATADLQHNPSGQLCCILDLSGLRPRNLDYRALLAIFELLQLHFPERLHTLHFLNGEPGLLSHISVHSSP